MKRFFQFFAALMLVSMTSAVIAVESNEQALRNFIKNTREFKADFSQSLFDEKGNELQYSAGKFSLKKPGKFAWQYEEPYRQTIISNGKLLWMYDSELEQVTVREVDESLTQTSMVLLFDYQDLDSSFQISDQGDEGEVHWFELISKSNNSEFNRIFIGLIKGQLAKLKLIDGFDQITLITFTNLDKKPQLADSSFDFIVPKGVDVIGNN